MLPYTDNEVSRLPAVGSVRKPSRAGGCLAFVVEWRSLGEAAQLWGRRIVEEDGL